MDKNEFKTQETSSVTVNEPKGATPLTANDKKADTAHSASSVDDDVIDVTIDDEDDEDDGIVQLSKSYKFDGQIIKEIDLSGLEDLGQKEAQNIDKIYKKFAKGNISVQPELTDEYAIVTAHHLTGLPLEFFTKMRHKDILKIRNRVINFTFGD